MDGRSACTHLDAVRYPSAVHPAGHIHCIAPDVILRLASPNDPSHNWSNVEPCVDRTSHSHQPKTHTPCFLFPASTFWRIVVILIPAGLRLSLIPESLTFLHYPWFKKARICTHIHWYCVLMPTLKYLAIGPSSRSPGTSSIAQYLFLNMYSIQVSV